MFFSKSSIRVLISSSGEAVKEHNQQKNTQTYSVRFKITYRSVCTLIIKGNCRGSQRDEDARSHHCDIKILNLNALQSINKSCCFYRLFVRIFLPMIWSDMVWNLSCICCSRVWTCETNGTNTVSATIKPQINKEGCFTEDGSHTLNLLLSWFLYFLRAASINKYHRNQTLMHKRKWLFRFNVLIAPRFNTTMKY